MTAAYLAHTTNYFIKRNDRKASAKMLSRASEGSGCNMKSSLVGEESEGLRGEKMLVG